MNAKELLDSLVELRDSGVDLSELEISVPYTEYSGSGAVFRDHVWPDRIACDQLNNELELI